MANDLKGADSSALTAATPAGRPTSIRYLMLAMVALAASSAYLTLFAAWTSTPGQLVTAMAVGTFFSGLAYPSGWAVTMDVAGDQTPIMIGVINMASTAAALAMPAALGYLIGDIERSGGSWNQVIYLFAGVHFAASVCWLAIRPEVPIRWRPTRTAV